MKEEKLRQLRVRIYIVKSFRTAWPKQAAPLSANEQPNEAVRAIRSANGMHLTGNSAAPNPSA
jgi:hypothetical protein